MTCQTAYPTPRAVDGPDWERRAVLFYRILPYPLLAASLGLAALSVGQGWSDWNRFALVAAVSLVAGGVVLWFSTLHPDWERHRGRMTGYLALRLALTAVLVVLNPWFGIFAWIGYVDAMRLPAYGGRAASVVVVLVTAGLMAGTEIGGFFAPTPARIAAFVVAFLLNMLLAGTMGAIFAFVQARNEQRRIALDELAAANEKLSATLRENAGLHAQLLSAAREAGVLDERARLAREIHDTIAQGLTGIITQLQAAKGVPEKERYLETSLGLARQSLGEARRSVQALRPAPLEDAHLPEAVTQVVADWSALHGVPATADTTGTPRRMHPEVEVTLLRACQESLANVARHARAGRVGVTLSYMEDVITLDVRDDGVGFDPDDRPEAGADGGFGLTGMRQRVTRLGGSLSVESEPGAGTAISAIVPAEPAAGSA
ncbi:sensor histidine kinase [Actinocatenispora rupis]|uniref:Oxygen sensor histidine kinase NreB n=1 Tax=Actinocatenispora rupis TaxID=519421 RepID=A0A8J3IXQ9_9ACTN|nr:sensor histidine kinase [Actinocatenispora rupis]GID10598.1 histidine kinase [Actinocatenispora rupis]